MKPSRNRTTVFEGFLAGFSLAILSLIAISIATFFYSYQNKFYPGIKVEEVDIGGKTREEAVVMLSDLPVEKPEFEVEFKVDDISVVIPPENTHVDKNYAVALSQAFEVGRTGFPLTRLWHILGLQFSPINIEAPYSLNPEAAHEHLNLLAENVDIEGENASASLRISGQSSTLTIFPGEPGRAIDKKSALSLAQDQVAKTLKPGVNQPEKITIEVPVASTAAVLNDEQVETAQERASLLVGEELKLIADNLNFTLNDQDLISFLTFPEGLNKSLIEEKIKVWAKDINRAPTNAEFEYDEDTLEVTKFVPHQNGLKLDFEKAVRDTENLIQDLERNLAAIAETESDANADTTNEKEAERALAGSPLILPVEVTKPETTLADTNDIGINELIGHGNSEYDHSIPNRIHNVALTTQKINNTLVPPGEEFSFNKTLGEVSARTGFRSAYVIKGGRTALGDGGGVCQVSTTVFRSVLDAGLPVTRRLQHSYRVSYYELNAKPGIDATVYSGDIDLRFKNDTDNYLLITGWADSEDLYMEINIYGTSDGRTAEITTHEVWGARPAPPPQYIETTDIPSGTTKQVDWAVGGVKTRVVNEVRDKNGELIREEEYYSNYVPWSAKYLVGI